MRNRRNITVLIAILLSLYYIDIKAQNQSRELTDLTEISQMLTSRYWVSLYYHNTQPNLIICGQLLEFKTSGEAVWHGIFKEVEPNNMSDLISFIDNENFRKMNGIPEKFVLSLSFEKCNRKSLVKFQRDSTKYTIGYLSDAVLVFLEKNHPPFIMISKDMLDCPDFVKEHLNYIPNDTSAKRIRGSLMLKNDE